MDDVERFNPTDPLEPPGPAWADALDGKAKATGAVNERSL
jgi:hypothetical protein